MLEILTWADGKNSLLEVAEKVIANVGLLLLFKFIEKNKLIEIRNEKTKIK